MNREVECKSHGGLCSSRGSQIDVHVTVNSLTDITQSAEEDVNNHGVAWQHRIVRVCVARCAKTVQLCFCFNMCVCRVKPFWNLWFLWMFYSAVNLDALIHFLSVPYVYLPILNTCPIMVFIK